MSAPERVFVGDIGGTNMRLGVACAEGLLEYEIVSTPKDPDEFFRVVGNTVLRLGSVYDFDVGAIGFPGPVRITSEGISVGPLTNIPSLDEPFDVNERVAAENESLRGFRILALNDAEAATHAAPSLLDEIHLGDRASGSHEQDVITYITHSTGIGGDSIKGGVVCSRADGMLAEYGHIPLLQADGSYETLENRVSGEAIKRRFRGNPSAEDWTQIGIEFGRGLATLMPVVGMSDIVIGGGASRAHGFYGDALAATLIKAARAIPSGVVEHAPEVTFVPENRIDILASTVPFTQYSVATKNLLDSTLRTQ